MTETNEPRYTLTELAIAYLAKLDRDREQANRDRATGRLKELEAKG